jgi:hypothetical protein
MQHSPISRSIFLWHNKQAQFLGSFPSSQQVWHHNNNKNGLGVWCHNKSKPKQMFGVQTTKKTEHGWQ